jgi:hypothetical protein
MNADQRGEVICFQSAFIGVYPRPAMFWAFLAFLSAI